MSFGSSGGGAPNPPVTNASPGGLWQGIDPISRLPVYALAAEDGRFQLIVDDGAPLTRYWGTLATSGNSLSSSNVQVATGTSYLGTGNAQSGSLSLTFNPVYNQGGALSRIAGYWQDVETNCVINGQVSTINTAFNAYSVSYSFSCCRFPYNLQNGTTATGLAFVDSGVTPPRNGTHGSVA